MTDVSLVIPIYRADAFLTDSLQKIDTYIRSMGAQWELVLTIDASPDRSADICREFAQQEHPYAVRIIDNATNLGKGGNLKRAMLEATGDYRIFIDCDLAYDLSDVTRMLESLRNGNDVAIASRAHPDTLYTINPKDFHYLYTRHLSSRLYNFVISHTLLRGWTDTQAGLKGFSGRAAAFIFSQTRLTGFSFDIEVLFIADRSQLKVIEVPVHFRYAQEPSTMDFLRDALRMLRDIWHVYSWGSKGGYCFNPPFYPPRRIVINADDFGLSHGINEGILAAMEKGVVGSTSLMPNFPDSVAAMQLAREKNLTPGWHVTLSLGRPVCDPTCIPSLVRKDGRFYPMKELLLRCILQRVRAEDVRRELEAQWKCFEEAGLRPEHIDGHQHCHVFPVIRDVVREMVTEHQIPLVRLPAERGGPLVPRYLTRLLLGCMKGSRDTFWKEAGCTTLPFYGVSLVGRAGDLAQWKQLLARISDPLSMVMVHPGIEHPGENLYGDDFPGSRQAELDLLLSAEWQLLLTEMRVEAIRFGANPGDQPS